MHRTGSVEMIADHHRDSFGDRNKMQDVMSVRVHDKTLSWDDEIETFAHKLRVLQHACTALPWVVNRN